MSSGHRGKREDKQGKLIIETLQPAFPKFTKVQLSLVRNPAYGLQLSSEAVLLLKGKGIAPPGKADQKSFKRTPKRSKTNRITVRLNDAQKVRLIEQVEQSECKSVQEYLEKLIQEKANEHRDDIVLGMSSQDEDRIQRRDTEG